VVDFAFAPVEVEARVGDTIRWTQRGSVFHTVTEHVRGAPVPGGFDGAVSEPGDTVLVVVTEPATIDYFCVPTPGWTGGSSSRPSMRSYIRAARGTLRLKPWMR
jgi:plastocyanin